MAAYYPNNVTTDHIQQYLDENKSLILKIVESQNSGKLSECAENQARLQRNLMYLAAIADSHSPPPAINSVQYTPGGLYQGAAGTTAQYLHHQQAQPQQQMTPQALMAARSSMLYGQQQPYPALQQHGLHSQLAMNSAGSSCLPFLQGESHNAGGGGGGGSLGIDFSDYGRASSSGGGGGSKHDIGSFLSVEGRGVGSSSGGNGGETLYFKSENHD